MKTVVDGIIFQDQPRGGVSRIFQEILPRMAASSGGPTFEIVLDGASRQPLPAHERIVVRHAPGLPAGWRPQGFWRPLNAVMRPVLLRPMKRGRAGSIWHSTYYTRLPGWPGPTVMPVYDMIHERFAPYFPGRANDAFRRRKRDCIESADAVICISAATRDDVLALTGADPGRVHVAPLACADIFFEPAPVAGPPQRPFALFVGPRRHYKNFDLLLEALPRLEGLELVAVGPPPMAQERDRAERGNGRVRFTGFVSDGRIRELYHQAACLVYPSQYEGFGIPLLEAMACGCPVVASDIPSSREVAADAALFFSLDGGPDALITAIREALAGGRGGERTRRGRERSREFSWGRTAAQTLEIYHRISDGA